MIEKKHRQDKPLAQEAGPQGGPEGGQQGSRLGQPAGLPDMLLYRLNRLRAVGGGYVLRYCEGHFGITRREWVILALLSDGATSTAGELAAKAGLPKAATSKAITSLAEKGLATRDAVQGDRRYARLGLTAEGLEVYQQILPIVAGVNSELMAGLNAGEVATLDRLLDSLEEQASLMAARLSSLPKADRRRGSAHRRAGDARLGPPSGPARE